MTGLRLTCLLDDGFTERLTHDIGVREEGDAGLLSRAKEVGSGEIEISSRVADPLLIRCRKAVKAGKSRVRLRRGKGSEFRNNTECAHEVKV